MRTVAKRPRFSRWRRLPRVYRSGEFKLPDPNPEPQRLTLYLNDEWLDAAEIQAARAGVDTVQEYCADLLRRAIEAERIRVQVAEVEARRGALEGLDAIANDPEYLAEWTAMAEGRGHRFPAVLPTRVEVTANAAPAAPTTSPSRASEPPSPDGLSAVARLILHHAGQTSDDPQAFLPCLRRGECVSVGEVAELARALQSLEKETRSDRALDRRVAFALHRLAYEGQVLHT